MPTWVFQTAVLLILVVIALLLSGIKDLVAAIWLRAIENDDDLGDDPPD